MKKWIAAILATLLLALSACVAKEPAASIVPPPTPEVTVATAPLSTPTPTPEPTTEPDGVPTIWGEQTMRATFVDEKGCAYFDMAFSFPYAAAPGYEAVNDYFAALLGAYDDEARGYAEESKADGYYADEDYDRYLYANTRAIYTSNRFLAFRLSRDCWLGGHRPNYEIFYVNLDLTTGKPLTLPGLFTDWSAARARILAELKRQIPEQYLDHLGGNPSPVEVDYDEMGERADQCLDDAPFLLTNSGVDFCFNKGYISFLADAPYTFTVPYEALSDLWALDETPVFTTEAECEELIPERPDTPTIWGERALRAKFVDEEGVAYFDADISMPYLPAPGYGIANDYFTRALRTYSVQIQEQAATLAEMDDTPEYAKNFSLCARGNAPYEKGRFLSLGTYEEAFIGGAHPYHRSTSACFDLSTGEEIQNLSDLFTDWPAARERILAEIQSRLKGRLTEDEYDLAAKRADEQLDTTPFYLTEDGLQIHYNEYALAAYAYGAFGFLIPYEIVEDIFIS